MPKVPALSLTCYVHRATILRAYHIMFVSVGGAISSTSSSGAPWERSSGWAAAKR